MLLSHYHRVRILLLLGILVSVMVFLGVSHVAHVPTYPGFGGSIFTEPHPLVALLLLAAGLILCVLLGTLIAGRVRFDAGLFCAVVGMSVLSFRSGIVGDVLRQTASSNSPVILISMAMEMLSLYGLLGLAWATLWLLHRKGWLRGDEFRDGVEDIEDSRTMCISAFAMQAGLTALAMLFIVQSDAKMQAVLGVGISAGLAAYAAFTVYPVNNSVWLWIGPLPVGVIGYLITYANPTGWQTGQLSFTLAALARPLPIDYATAGPAGALIGYWMARRAYQQRKEAAAEAEGA